MTLEAFDTYEAYDIDYTPQFEELIEQVAENGERLDTIIIQGEDLEYLENLSALQYLPHIYKVNTLILSVIILYILTRFVAAFLNRFFSDSTRY